MATSRGLRRARRVRESLASLAGVPLGPANSPRPLFRPLSPKPLRPRKPVASMNQVAGSGMGDEPMGPDMAEACTTNRSSDVASMTSLRRTPPPQVHESLGLAMHAAPSSDRASKPGPPRWPKPRMSKLSPVSSVKPLAKSIARPPSSVVSLVTVSAPLRWMSQMVKIL